MLWIPCRLNRARTGWWSAAHGLSKWLDLGRGCLVLELLNRSFSGRLKVISGRKLARMAVEKQR